MTILQPVYNTYNSCLQIIILNVNKKNKSASFIFDNNYLMRLITQKMEYMRQVPIPANSVYLYLIPMILGKALIHLSLPAIDKIGKTNCKLI